MKTLYLLLAAVCFLGCNSGSGKKDPNKTMDDTARLDLPPSDDPKSFGAIELNAADVPSTISFKGKFQSGWKWSDAAGENWLVCSRTDPRDHRDEYGDEVSSAEIFAVQYHQQKGGSIRKTWELSEAVKDCAFDITCEFIPGSTAITDLDHDRLAETTVAYRLSCRSDVSPSFMKVLMHEDTAAYSLQGLMWLPYSPEIKYDVTEADVNLEHVPKLPDENEQMLKSFGRYENERSFYGAPAAFLMFAKRHWLNYSKEKIGE